MKDMLEDVAAGFQSALLLIVAAVTFLNLVWVTTVLVWLCLIALHAH